MHIFDTHYCRLNKLFLSIIGLWPFRKSVLMEIAWAMTVCSVVITFSTQSVCVYKHRKNVHDLINIIRLVLAEIVVGSKVCVLTYKSEKLSALIQSMQSNWETIRKDPEVEILKRYLGYGRKITVSYGMYVIVPATFYVLSPLQTPIFDIIFPLNETRERRLLSGTDHLINEKENFFAIVCVQCFGYFYLLLILLACDPLYYALVEHACGMFAILSYRFENLSACDVNRNSLSKTDNDEYNYCIECIRLHIRTERFIKLISSTFGGCLLIDTCLGILVHSALCIMILVNGAVDSDFAGHVLVEIATCTRLFLNSFSGQRLMDHSSALWISVYDGMWYETSLKTQKLWPFLLAKTHVVCVISIAGIYVLNFDSFGMVMKTSLSYCTIMASLTSA